MLANEKDNQVSSCRCLSISHVQIFTLHPSLCGHSDVRFCEQDIFNFIGHYIMLVSDLLDDLVLPDNFIEMQRDAKPAPFSVHPATSRLMRDLNGELRALDYRLAR